MGLFTTQSIEDYLRGMIVSKLNVVLSRILTSVFEIPASMDKLNTMMRVELLTDFDGLGLLMHDLFVQAISLPDEVQQKIDTKSGMNVLGNLDQYMKLKIADSLGDAAKSGGGMGDGLGLGAGLGMGMALPNMIQQNMQPASGSSVALKLKELKELLDLDAITQDEFDKKKQELLKQL
jgi:membrane protease subunit (stomatin/prohibitin family)